MGSSFKNNNNHNQRGNNSSNSSKPYALMLLLAFGAAILGVMVLHKIREKRIFSLLVKEKDHELLTLHLLFQREKEFNQEARKKIEEMNNKVYSLRTQRLELDRRLSEMESTISSLRNEIQIQRQLNLSSIQILTDGKNLSSGDPPQVTVLEDMLKMKDAEIDDLKFQLNKQEDVHSETTKLVTSSIRDESENDGDLQLNSDSFTDSTMGDNRSQNDYIELNEVKDGVELKKENTKTDDKTTDYHTDKGTKAREENAKETNTSNEEEKQRLQEHQATDDLKDTGLLRGGLKLEKPDGSVNGYGSRARRRHSKGKRREALRNRRSGDDDLYSVSKTGSTPLINSNEEQQKFNQARKIDSEVKIDLSEKHQLPLSDTLNHITDTGSDGQAREEEAETRAKREIKLIEKQSNTTEETEQVYEHGRWISMEKHKNAKTNVENNKVYNVQKIIARKKSSDEITNQIIDQEGNREQEKISSIKLKKQVIDNEQGNEIAIEESDAEDSDDVETNEPEIDRDDIRRFSESDEEAEETEF